MIPGNKILVTGASGFLGSHLICQFRRSAIFCKILVRNENWNGLGDNCTPDVFRDVNTIVHCAWDFTPGREISSYVGSYNLLELAHKHGVKRIINISTMSSFEGCKSEYGKAKLRLESFVSSLGGVSLRCGLLWHADKTGGMIGKMKDSIARSRIVPVVGTGLYPQFTTNLDDLTNYIVEIASKPDLPTGVQSVVAQPSIPFIDLLTSIMIQNSFNRPLIHIPWQILYLCAKCSEFAHISVPFKSDSIIGLVFSSGTALNPVDRPMIPFQKK